MTTETTRLRCTCPLGWPYADDCPNCRSNLALRAAGQPHGYATGTVLRGGQGWRGVCMCGWDSARRTALLTTTALDRHQAQCPAVLGELAPATPGATTTFRSFQVCGVCGFTAGRHSHGCPVGGTR